MISYFKSKNITAKPVNNQYLRIKDVDTLFNLLLECRSKETCTPRMQDEWSENNKTLGQCSITSFLVQDIFGGKVYGIKLEDGSIHCFNKIHDEFFDLTSSQFGDRNLNYLNAELQNREKHFSKEEKYNRYLKLKVSLENKNPNL